MKRTGDESKLFLSWLGEKGYTSRLTGWMNVFVRDLSGHRTEVRVTARYVVEALARNGTAAWQWGFDTGKTDTVRERRCAPTYVAEQQILNAARGGVR